MIDMFTNYQNLNKDYIPNNLSQCTPKSYTSKLDPCEITKPYELYDAKGDLEGYYWYYGESIVLDFSIDGEITELEANGYVSLEDYLKDKTASLKLYDFRGVAVFCSTIKAATQLVFSIDSEMSKKIVKGTYGCELAIFNNNVSHKIFNRNDCTFLVK